VRFAHAGGEIAGGILTDRLHLGFLAAVLNNIPLTALALKERGYDWGFLAYTVGIAGSAHRPEWPLTDLYPEARSVGRSVRHDWFVTLAYLIGFFVMLSVRSWHSDALHREETLPASASYRADPSDFPHSRANVLLLPREKSRAPWPFRKINGAFDFSRTAQCRFGFRKKFKTAAASVGKPAISSLVVGAFEAKSPLDSGRDQRQAGAPRRRYRRTGQRYLGGSAHILRHVSHTEHLKTSAAPADQRWF
jgi:hypothetical protein